MGGFDKQYTPSKELSVVVGSEKVSRPQIVKRLWDHIKEKKLQAVNDKRIIVCDTALSDIFKKDSISMFEMNKLISGHLS